MTIYETVTEPDRTERIGAPRKGRREQAGGVNHLGSWLSASKQVARHELLRRNTENGERRVWFRAQPEWDVSER